MQTKPDGTMAVNIQHQTMARDITYRYMFVVVVMLVDGDGGDGGDGGYVYPTLGVGGPVPTSNTCFINLMVGELINKPRNISGKNRIIYIIYLRYIYLGLLPVPTSK